MCCFGFPNIKISFFVQLVLGRPRVCPGISLGLSLGQTRVFSLFYTVEALRPRVCPWDKPSLSLGQSRGRRAAQKVYVKKVFVPFLLAILSMKKRQIVLQSLRRQKTMPLVNHAFAHVTPVIFAVFVVFTGLSSKALVVFRGERTWAITI